MMPTVVALEMIRLHEQHKRYGIKSALARAAGVTPTTTAEWLAGTTPPSPQYWPAVEAFFDLAPGHFTRLTAPEGQGTPDEWDQVRTLLVDLQRRAAQLEADARGALSRLDAADPRGRPGGWKAPSKRRAPR